MHKHLFRALGVGKEGPIHHQGPSHKKVLLIIVASHGLVPELLVQPVQSCNTFFFLVWWRVPRK